MRTALTFQQLAGLAPSLGVFDITCPLCSAVHNPRRRVLRIWREEEHFIGFACARCGEKGWTRSDYKSAHLLPERSAEIRREVAERQAAEQARSRRKALALWAMSLPISSRAPPFVYLREVRSYSSSIPATLRYLPPRTPEHHHAMIAAFGMPDEPEPGVYAIANHRVGAVHLTFLRPDGSGKANVDAPKIIIGQGAAGLPICLFPPNDLLGLAITEGIEDALSIGEATGLGAWAAGCASRLPATAEHVPPWTDCVTVIPDQDPAGENNAHLLHRALLDRGIHAELVSVAARSSAAA
jgi:Toprim domain